MAKKQNNPFLEKKEEKLGKDLDGDNEKGESKAHRAKVLGKASAPAKGGKKNTPPAFLNKKVTVPNAKMSKPSPGTGTKVCPTCKGKGLVSCTHM